MNFEEIQRKLHHTPYVYANVGNRLKLAQDVQLQNAIINCACGTVTIGRGTFAGYNVMILTGSHSLDGSRSRAVVGRDIVIGSDVWLASGCIILGPCTIGDRCVVGAGGVVPPRSVLEPGWVYMGVPVRKVRPAIDYRSKDGAGVPLLTDQRKRK